MKAEEILFFSENGFFRLKSIEKQQEKFSSLKADFLAEFGQELHDHYFDALIEYQSQKRAAKKAREKAKLEKIEKLSVSGGFDNVDDHVKQLPAGKYVLTSAQNNTDIDKTMLLSLLNFCEKNEAKLLVARLTYNKQGFLQPDIEAQDLWYDPKIKPYLVEGHISLDNKYHFIADANVIPTAKNPLSGFDGITKAGIHVIIPASKIALKVTAALKNSPVKILASTGTVTKRNYILRKAGAVAAIEHNIGALFIDTENNVMRHLEQMENFNGFYDFHVYYNSMGWAESNNVTVLQLGDIHAEKMEEKNLENALKTIEYLQPDNIIIHDVLDFSSRNHHNIKDSTFIHLQHVHDNTVKNDLKLVAKVIDSIQDSANYGGKVHIIESNHDLAINTWLKNADFKADPVNAVTYLTCMLALYKHQERYKSNNFNMLKYAYKAIGKGEFSDKIQFHETDESVIISGVEMGCHGHNGVNGSRGSPTQFRGLGIAMNTGHTHTPGICGKVYTAGVTASLEMGYNVGASSWMIAHIVTYSNGQRQLIFM